MGEFLQKVLICLPVVLGAALIIFVGSYPMWKWKKLEKIAYGNLEASQTNENVDEFMKFISKYGIVNQPPVWNRVRGIWFMVNESQNVTTEKKTELRNLLVSKGLRLTPNERKIIDNNR